jgi:hypothetical protein
MDIVKTIKQKSCIIEIEREPFEGYLRIANITPHDGWVEVMMIVDNDRIHYNYEIFPDEVTEKTFYESFVDKDHNLLALLDTYDAWEEFGIIAVFCKERDINHLLALCRPQTNGEVTNA